ncbi:MAG TPA: TonB-dependent receptor [Steroidobacteraceae bacterium]|nr:TonB-dependent receptor [Steroidobacteraceae bacterium]
MSLISNSPARKLACIAAVSVLAHSYNAAADSPEAKSPDEVIVTARRAPQSLQTYAGSATEVNADAIDLLGATHHSEAINRVAGAMIQRNSGQESLTAIRSPVLSGPGSCGEFLFLENSVPIRPVGFCNVNELFEVQTEQAQRIEVLRGPTGVVYGSGAMHGTVNVIHTPEDARSFLAVETGADDYYRGKLSVAQSGEHEAFQTAITATHDGGWRDSSGLEEQKLNVEYDRDRQWGVSLAATHLDQQTAGFIQGQDAYRDDALAKSNPNPEAYRRATAVRLTGHYQNDLNSNVQLSLRPFLRYSRMNFLQHFLIGKPVEENGQQSGGLLSSLDIALGASTHLLTGVDLELADGFLQETQSGPATDGPPAANAVRPAGKHYDYDVKSRVMAGYAQLEQSIASQWTATLGARFESVHYNYDNRMLAGNTREDGTTCGTNGCLYSRPADRDDTFNDLTARASLAYQISPDHMTYVAVARGSRAPDTNELYRLQRQQSIANLDSESLDSIEVGARGHIERFNYSLAAFAMRKNHFIFRDSNGLNVSDGKTKHRGIEYELQYRPIDSLGFALAGTIAKHTYDFNRTIDAGETIVAGRDIDTAPRHINTARVDWRAFDRVNSELELVSVGHYFIDASNAHTYGGYRLLNLRFAWQLSNEWSSTIRVDNLTDAAYADRADFAFGNYRYFPGRGRTVFWEVRYGW